MTRRASAAARRVMVAMATLLLVVLTAACTTSQEPEMDPRAELLARPSSEQAVERYQQMQRRVQDSIEAVIGPQTWKVSDKPAFESCGFGPFYQQKGAGSVALPRIEFAGSITDEQWPRLQQAIDGVLGEYDFSTEGLVVRNQDGIRDINAVDRATGGQFTFRSVQGRTLVRMTTGCHLPQARKTGS